jgi:hypothetical protein
MNIVKALVLSKENGRQYSRMSGGGWIRYKEKFTYRLGVDDLLADDWEDTAEAIDKITNGRWALAEGEAKA